ncbi:MAG: elongation factor G [Actinobacteria bacterium]|nr:elongation factor G [Actinomycetota bacterium]
MKIPTIDKIRNVGIIAHGGSGKTSLVEAMLYDSGITTRLGKIEDGTTTTDFDADEIKRKISINLSIASFEFKDHKINIIDTPGYADFIGEVISALRVVDSAIVVLSAVSGVEVQSEIVWKYAEEQKIPKIIFVNKMDRENADFYKAVEMAKNSFGSAPTAIHLPVGSAESFKGIVDLIKMKAIVYKDTNPCEEEIPPELSEKATEFRDALIESVAETDEALLEKYLEGAELTEKEIADGLKNGVISGSIVPILCGSATKNLCIQLLINTVLETLPSPKEKPDNIATDKKSKEEIAVKNSEKEPFSALVFKTIIDPFIGRLSLFRVYSGEITSNSQAYNSTRDKNERIGQILSLCGKKQEPLQKAIAGDIGALAKLQETTTGDTLCDHNHPILLKGIEFPKPIISTAIEPKSKGDEDKLGSALSKLSEGDLTFNVKKDIEVHQTIVSGMGENHIDVMIERLKEKFGVDTEIVKLKIPYKETIQSSVKVQGKHKKQSGGHGQYGDCWLELEPLEKGKGFEFANKIFGGSIPKQYIPAVEKGVIEAMQKGVLAGYQVVDVKVTVYDGSYHSVDSSEMAFKIAGSLAFRNGILQANPVILEPIVNIEVTAPESYMGDIIGDLNSKRGRILGMEPIGNSLQSIKAQIPLAEISKYANDLRSITQGRGVFETEFSHYEEVPSHLSQKIIEETKLEKES